MEKFYVASQIVGFIAFLISIIAYHRSKKEKIFKTMIFANLLDITHYFLLGAYSGCLTKVVALIRNEIIILKGKNEKFNNKILLLILAILYIITGIFTYDNIFSILPIIAAMIYLFYIWDGNELTVKKVSFYCYFLWLAYNICVCSMAGILSNCVAIISTYIAVEREKIKNK